MVAKSMSKAGPITLALGLIIGGLVLLLYNFGALASLEWLWKLWPVLIIGVGLEYFIKKAINREGEVNFHFPSVLLIVLLIMSSGVLYAASNITKNLNGFIGGIPFHQTKLTFSRTWESEPVEIKAGEQLYIENEVGKVELLPTSGKEVKVIANIQSPLNGPARELAEKLNPGIKRENDKVHIWVPKTEDVNNQFLVTDLQVTVPDGVDVRIESGTGRVIAENMDINLVVTGTTGTIELNEIAGNIEASNNTGRLVIANPGGNVLAETNTGSIEMSSSRSLADKYNLKSNTGRITLEMPQESDIVISAKSGTGRVSVHGLPENTNRSGPSDEYNHKLGTGQGQANLEVGTGAINIRVR